MHPSSSLFGCAPIAIIGLLPEAQLLIVVYKSSSTRYVIQQFGTYCSYSMEITWVQNRTASFFLNGEYITKYQGNYRIVYL